MADQWTLWVEQSPRPGWANMAIDRALLDRAEALGEHWLRLYSWNPCCLSFGRHEPAARRYDSNRIAALGLDTVRRPTGGRAVWHSAELTYAVAAPSRSFGSLPSAYLEIHRMLLEALQQAGLRVSLAAPAAVPALDAGPCFARPVGGEILCQGRKLVGSAQLRRGGAFLQHGSILLRDEQQVVAACVRGGRKVSIPERLSQKEPYQADGLPAAGLAEAIAAASRRRWTGSWRDLGDADEVLRSASGYTARFRSAAWTWER
jgi:lipoyl(octanoyl) transferase